MSSYVCVCINYLHTIFLNFFLNKKHKTSLKQHVNSWQSLSCNMTFSFYTQKASIVICVDFHDQNFLKRWITSNNYL